MMKFVLLTVSHAIALALGFAIGIYTLPILIAPKGPSVEEVKTAAGGAEYTAEFRRDLKGSDLFHWGEGKVSVSRSSVSLMGKVAPGPDYKLYLSPEFVETEDDFARVKGQSVRVGDVKSFENFIVAVPPSVDVSRYSAVIVWCETFSQFITAAKYR
jgi:Electron transfer DM13